MFLKLPQVAFRHMHLFRRRDCSFKEPAREDVSITKYHVCIWNDEECLTAAEGPQDLVWHFEIKFANV